MSPDPRPGCIVPDWPAPPRVMALVTTRSGGESEPPFDTFNLGMRVGDVPERVMRNRARLREVLPAEPRWMDQVHGAEVIDATGATGIPRADGAFTRRTGVVCVVQSADCLPILLCDDAGTVVGAAHAGWRGLAAGIIEASIRAMDVAGDRLLAYLGPAIGPAAYEVGPEVRAAFTAADEAAEAAFAARPNGKYLCDLYAIARQRLGRARVERVHGGGFCTHGEPGRFFSYRRDGPTGRMAACIWMAPS